MIVVKYAERILKKLKKMAGCYEEDDDQGISSSQPQIEDILEIFGEDVHKVVES